MSEQMVLWSKNKNHKGLEATERGACFVGWSALPDEIGPLVFEFCGPRERIVVLERVCRRWRDESQNGGAWPTTFDCRSALWRDFVRFNTADAANPSERPRTFAEYLGRMGTRLSKLERFDNIGSPDTKLSGGDAPLFPLVLTSPHLHSVLLASAALPAFVSSLVSVAPRLTRELALFHVGAWCDARDAFDTLFSRLRPRRLCLSRVAASPTAYTNLACGAAAATLFKLYCKGDIRDRPQNLAYIDGLRALRHLALVSVSCANLPTNVSAVRELLLNRVRFEPACYDTPDDSSLLPSTPFGRLERMVLMEATELRIACATVVRSDASLRTLALVRLQAIENTPAATRLLSTLGSCRLPRLTAFAVAAPGLAGFWSHAVTPILSNCLARLETLMLRQMPLDDGKLVSLALLAHASIEEPRDVAMSIATTDTAAPGTRSVRHPTLILTHLSLADNPDITVDGLLAFATAVDLARLQTLDVRRLDPLLFSPPQLVALAAKLPPLCKILV
jgi:hypothetical protein